MSSSPTRSPRPRVIVVGGGLVGLLTAIALAKRHFHVDVYEKRSDVRKDDNFNDRSINLTLSTRAFQTLELFGIAEEIKEHAIPLVGRMEHDIKGCQTSMKYDIHGKAIFAIDRKLLICKLLDITESYPNIDLHFELECQSIDLETPAVTFINKETGTSHTKIAEFIVGADGAYSSVRRTLMKTTELNYEQTYIDHQYKQLEIPSNNGKYALLPDYLHIWPRSSYTITAFPNLDKSFICTLFFPKQVFETLHESDRILEFFKINFPDLVSLIGATKLVSDFKTRPTLPLLSIKCNPYNYRGKVLIVGDAAHCMVPFYGQGVNAGFEDVYLLYQLLEKFDNDSEIAFSRFTAVRHKDATAICDLAMAHYRELAESKRSITSWLGSAVSNTLYYFFPSTFIPLYSMVSFTAIPYSQVIKRAKCQRFWMRFIPPLLLFGVLLLNFYTKPYRLRHIFRFLRRLRLK